MGAAFFYAKVKGLRRHLPMAEPNNYALVRGGSGHGLFDDAQVLVVVLSFFPLGVGSMEKSPVKSTPPTC